MSALSARVGFYEKEGKEGKAGIVCRRVGSLVFLSRRIYDSRWCVGFIAGTRVSEFCRQGRWGSRGNVPHSLHPASGDEVGFYPGDANARLEAYRMLPSMFSENRLLWCYLYVCRLPVEGPPPAPSLQLTNPLHPSPVLFVELASLPPPSLKTHHLLPPQPPPHTSHLPPKVPQH